MKRKSNCREQNLDRKANVEKKLRKLGIKRSEEILRNSSGSDHDPNLQKFALQQFNVPREMQDMADFLLSLQFRDVTPEDYDILLRLDESVQNKTVSEKILVSLKTDTASKDHVDDVCAVCMENYKFGQTRKILPCKHVFHSDCIATWLRGSSNKCPLDGREL